MKNQILVSAGDAITAKLVQESGFDGIWISGFESSARLGLPDNGSITMTEMLNIAKPVVDAVQIPVWVDVDTGYGNFQRTVKEFEKIGVSGLCIQDDVEGYKTNSLWGGASQLMDYFEFANKINVERKIKIIARTEALIRGYGFADALIRGVQYAKHADYVLIHSRDQKGLEVLKIIGAWKGLKQEAPLVIVPTKFPGITNKHLFNIGYSMVIWANQTERVKIKATRECLGSLKSSDCAEYIESNLSATLEDMKGLIENG
jgi:phosphoenolpyruvate phosphomutase